MTSNAAADNRIVGTLRTADGKGVVRMEDCFDTDVDDLWSALTDPGRLARTSTIITSRRIPPCRYCSASPVISASTVWVICSVTRRRVFQAK